MREEVAYREMQEEMARERQGQEAGQSPRTAPESEGAAAHQGAPDPSRKERAYPHLPGEGALP